VTVLNNVPDGTHYFGLRARDGSGNVDPTPAIVRFVVEGTPPSPILTSPFHDAVARGELEIRGTTVAPRFRFFELAHRRFGSSFADSAWKTSDLTLTMSPARAGEDTVLGVLDTRSLADGEHELRLSVTNSLNLVGASRVLFRVDNHAPWDSVTSPAQIPRAGGDVYTLDGAAHVYFPTGTFPDGARVFLDPSPPGDLFPAPAGTRLLDPGFAVAWGEAALDSRKVPLMDFQVADSLDGLPIAVWRFGSDETWSRVGGSVDTRAGRVSFPLPGPETYALFEENVPVDTTVPLASIRLTPRVLDLRDVMSSARRMAIAFRLGRASEIAARVYNRAGRLVRNLADGVFMSSGENVLFWDGRNGDGELVREGLYVITIEANGERISQAAAVTE
jgi:hypothetical protein